MISIDLCAWTYTVRDYIKLLGAVPTSTVYVVTASVLPQSRKYITRTKMQSRSIAVLYYACENPASKISTSKTGPVPLSKQELI